MSSRGRVPLRHTHRPVSATIAGSCQPTPKFNSDATLSSPRNRAYAPLPPSPARARYGQCRSDTSGEMAQLTMCEFGRANRGTSSQPPAKSTRNGAWVGARMQLTNCVVDTGVNWGGVLSSTWYRAPTCAHSARFKSPYRSSSVTARMSGRRRRKWSSKSRPNFLPSPITTRSTTDSDAMIAALCSSGNELLRCLCSHNTSAEAKHTVSSSPSARASRKNWMCPACRMS